VQEIEAADREHPDEPDGGDRTADHARPNEAPSRRGVVDGDAHSGTL
jgi:hypothetical protein